MNPDPQIIAKAADLEKLAFRGLAFSQALLVALKSGDVIPINKEIGEAVRNLSAYTDLLTEITSDVLGRVLAVSGTDVETIQ